MRRIILIASFSLALSSQAMAGSIYQWVDAQGQSHFGAQPPQGVQATLVSTGTGNGTGKTGLPPTSELPKLKDEREADAQKAIDAQVKQKVAKQEAELKQYCNSLRTNLSELENNPRISVQENGQARRLTEEERQSRISDAQKQIKENCE
jgi:hypothetical protein